MNNSSHQSNRCDPTELPSMPCDGRPKKPRFVRTKTGCYSCRLRKKKCDGQKPMCKGCERNILLCSWPDEEEQNSKNTATHRKPRQRDHIATSAYTVHDSSASKHNQTKSQPSKTSIAHRKSPSTVASNSSPYCDPAAFQFVRTYQQLFDQPQPWVYGVLSQPTSRILFEYYFHKTARHVSAHPRDFNPFIHILMPWAISNDLILQTMLAWSGSHLSIISSEVKETTCAHYAQAIRGIKFGLTKHTAGEEDLIMPLLVSTLMLCFIETTRGNHHGSAFYHVRAARQLLFQALKLPVSKLDKEVRAFIIEHYIYVAILSNISMGPESDDWVLEDAMILIPQIYEAEHKATGMFCGAAHNLFLLIPEVSSFSHRLIHEHVATGAISWATLSAYYSLKARVTSWMPQSDDEAFRTCGLIYQHTLLAHIECAASSVSGPNADEPLAHEASGAVEEAVETAMALLESLPLDAEISTTLCWPLAVLGACTAAARHRRRISARLKIMYRVLGFHNLCDTEDLLQAAWTRAGSACPGPWNLEAQMRHRGQVIAFL